MKEIEAGPMPCPHHSYDLVCRRGDRHYQDTLNWVSSYLAFLSQKPEGIEQLGIGIGELGVEKLSKLLKENRIFMNHLEYVDCRLDCKKPRPIKAVIFDLNTGEAQTGEIETSF